MKGTFTRISPATFAEKIGIPAGWFVISYTFMPKKSERRLAHGRWYTIKSTEGRVIHRILRFSPNLQGSPTSNFAEIVLDWPGWLDLHGRAEEVDQPLELTFKEVKWWAYPKMALAHPDPTVRLAGELGLLSVCLGALSIVLAVIAL